MARSELRSPVVLDTTVASNFAFTNDISLLTHGLDARVVLVPAVVDELVNGVEAGHNYLASALESIEIIETESEPDERVREQLDYGEAYALDAAATLGGTLATDDFAARTIADVKGVDLTGSVGLLLELIACGELTVTEADNRLQRWIDENSYLSPVERIQDAVPDSDE